MSGTFVRRAGVAAFVVWLIWALHPLLAKRMLIPLDLTKVGQWGDAFGALNALFSALAFVAVLFTLKQQRDDVARQLQQQRDDLARQQAEIKKSEQSHHRQRFEDIFFQLLSVIRENRQDVRFANSKEYLAANPKAIAGTKKGQFAFRAAYRELRYWVRQEFVLGSQLDRQALAALYATKVHKKYESALGAYFRLVYETLDRVERDPHLSDEEKNEFGNLVRGQMTSFEATIAGCNALNDFAKDFERLVNRFRLLKYSRVGEVYNELIKYYPSDTFQGRETNRPPVPDINDEVDDDLEHDE